MAVTRATRSRLVGALDRAVLGLVGLVGGTFAGLLVGNALGIGLSPWLALPRIWATWFGCCCGVFTAVVLAARAGAPWVRLERSGARATTRHGWVDLVVRAALGMAGGALAGGATGYVLHTWLEAAGAGGRGDVLARVLPGVHAGWILGLLWFATNLPWLPGRRAVRAPSARRG